MNNNGNKIDNTVNHFVFAIDDSLSMDHLESKVIEVIDAEIAYRAEFSKRVDQETRVSVFFFSAPERGLRCAVYDKDVMRLPSLRGHYRADGRSTALIDGAYLAINEVKDLPQKYGDHSFLLFVVTDGQENDSKKYTVRSLTGLIENLPDNWTTAILVPNQAAVFEAKKFGFPRENIQVWDAASKVGVERAGSVIREASDNYMHARAAGVRSVKNLFEIDVSKLSVGTIERELEEISAREYAIWPVYQDTRADDFVNALHKASRWHEEFRLGSVHYQLTKPETVQPQKAVMIRRKRDGKVYGGRNARQLLGLPDFNVKINPASAPDFDIFIQSTAPNRKLIKDTNVLVLK
jgi:hypothetical protein